MVVERLPDGNHCDQELRDLVAIIAITPQHRNGNSHLALDHLMAKPRIHSFPPLCKQR
jgi:hypothetical protein